MLPIFQSPNFAEKLKDFKKKFSLNSSSFSAIFDFDFTMTQKYTYKPMKSDKCHYSCYKLFALGELGNNKIIDEECEKINEKYSVYENDKSIDFNKRKKYLYEWYCESLKIMVSIEFRRSEITDLIINNPNYYEFRPKLIECLKLLLSMHIPIIIISGGIEEVVVDVLRLYFNDIESLIEKNELNIISNKFIYDNNNSGKVVDYDRNIVFTLNKDEFLKSFINKSFPTITNCFCFGDNYADYDCVLNILEGQKDKLIGYGFLNFLPSKFGKEENKTEEEESLNGYKKVFDVVQLNDSGFEIVVENLKFIKGEKIME